jgi:hypothetical protein
MGSVSGSGGWGKWWVVGFYDDGGNSRTQRKNNTVTSINGYMDSRNVSSAARVRLSSRWRSVDFLKKPIVKFRCECQFVVSLLGWRPVNVHI